LPLVLPWWLFSLYSPLCAGDKMNEEEEERLDDQDNLGFSHNLYLFSFLLYFLFLLQIVTFYK
jgi:hypothetical protein